MLLRSSRVNSRKVLPLTLSLYILSISVSSRSNLSFFSCNNLLTLFRFHSLISATVGSLGALVEVLVFAMLWNMAILLRKTNSVTVVQFRKRKKFAERVTRIEDIFMK